MSVALTDNDRLTITPENPGDALTPEAQPFSALDLGISAFLLALYSLLTIPALGALEFFRHTEADRSLIAIEMARTGEYLVPHLLGSVILTKPPLFYWLVASSISFFGGIEEWVVRLPSAIAAILFVAIQFLFCRLLGQSRQYSLFSAAALGTSVLFFTLSLAAEIDMVFGFLCALTLYLYALAANRRSLPLTAAAYVAAALAFLTKGPPILGFLGASAIAYLVVSRRERESIGSFLLRNLLGALFFLLIAGLWLAAIASHVGWESLYRSFEVEVLQRVVEESTHKHGVLFYPAQAILGLAPWSFLGVLGLCFAYKRRAALKATLVSSFTLFNLCVTLTAIAMLSLAEGKSARYLFPIYPFVANLSVTALWHLRDSRVERYLARFAQLFFILLIAASLAAPWFVSLEGVSNSAFVYPSALALIASAVGLWGVARSSRSLLVSALMGVMVVAQIGMGSIFAPYRNATCSVRGMVGSIEAAVPEGARIYTVEMFERWVVYYLIRDGREVYRLDAPRIAEAKQTAERAYLLLSFTEEAWRVRQLEFYDPTLRELGEFSTERDHLLLIDVASSALPYLEPLPFFPTIPSYPFYAEVEFQTGKAAPR